LTTPPGGKVNIALVGDNAVFPQLTASMQGTIQMAIDEAGPVQGFSLSLIVFDGGCGDSQAAIGAASKVVADPTVTGVVGHLCSGSCVPGSDVYEGAHVVMISPSCTAPNVTERGLQVVNRVCTRDDRGGDEVNAAIVETSAYRQFVGRYSSLYGSAPASEHDIVFYVAYAYDAANVLIRAIKQVAVVDASGNLVIGRQALAHAVRATSGYQGVTGTISFDSKGDRIR
jgi:ABC-type branched-subunit amino acid transport system substrate-binding protein